MMMMTVSYGSFQIQPHLIKTARNSLYKSGSARNSRYIWNNNRYLLWSHIANFYHEDTECDLNYFPNLTNDHISMNAYSIMNVKLAAQILSTTVGNTILDFGPDEAKETRNFSLLMDSFFDCCNVRNTKECINKYINDERFDWLKNTFLLYFADWKNNIETRSGKYFAIEKSRMFIAHQTHEGITMTDTSLIECVQFLLGRGLPYVLRYSVRII